MLYKRLILLIGLTLGIVFLNLIYNHPKYPLLAVYDKEIRANIHTLNTISMDVDDFSDLVFLDTIIGNKQIVFLGEQLHSDGTTFQAKARLIRYLHETHGFDIILYEAGLYDMWFINHLAMQQVRDTAQFYPAIGLYSFWWDNEDCKPLWQYYNKTLQSDNPITLGGFDVQLTGTYRDKNTRAKSIKDFLSEKQIDIEDFPSFNSVVGQLSYTYKWEYKQFSQVKFNSIQIDLVNILERLHIAETEEDNIYYRYLKGIHDYGQLMWDYNPGEMPRMNARDSLIKYTDAHQYAYNPWTTVLGRYIFSFYSFMYPLVIAIFSYSFCEIEYKHNNIKQLFTLPVTKQKIYLAKSVLLIEVILFSVLIAYFLFMLSGYIMSYTMREYNFQNYDSRIIIGTFFFRMLIACLTIAFVQFFLSLKFNNFIVPVGVACFGVVFMLIASSWEYIDLIPYASIWKANSAFFQGSTELITNLELINSAYIIIFFLLCYWGFINLIKRKS